MAEENVAPVSHPAPTVSVQDFLDLTEKVYSLKDPAPFKLSDDSDWQALVAEFKAMSDKVTAMEAPKAPTASTPSPNLSAFDARAKAIEDRLEIFNSRSGQHI